MSKNSVTTPNSKHIGLMSVIAPFGGVWPTGSSMLSAYPRHCGMLISLQATLDGGVRFHLNFVVNMR